MMLKKYQGWSMERFMWQLRLNLGISRDMFVLQKKEKLCLKNVVRKELRDDVVGEGKRCSYCVMGEGRGVFKN